MSATSDKRIVRGACDERKRPCICDVRGRMRPVQLPTISRPSPDHLPTISRPSPDHLPTISRPSPDTNPVEAALSAVTETRPIHVDRGPLMTRRTHRRRHHRIEHVGSLFLQAKMCSAPASVNSTLTTLRPRWPHRHNWGGKQSEDTYAQ